MDALGILSNRLYPEHYSGRENTIFIGKVTDTAVFFGNVADGFDSYTISGALGGLENIVFFDPSYIVVGKNKSRCFK